MAKKKRTVKQIAATKKMLAGLKKYKARKTNPKKKRARKKVAKKRIIKKHVSKKRVTKKKVVKRKKRKVAKRKTATKKLKEYYIVTSSSSHNYKYFTGERFTSIKKNAAFYRDLKTVKRIAQLVAERDPRKIYIRTVELEKT